MRREREGEGGRGRGRERGRERERQRERSGGEGEKERDKYRGKGEQTGEEGRDAVSCKQQFEAPGQNTTVRGQYSLCVCTTLQWQGHRIQSTIVVCVCMCHRARSSL